MEKIKKIWNGIKAACSWLSKKFKALFFNPAAAIAWVAAGLIFLMTNGPGNLFSINTITLYALILILVLAVKMEGK
ncbi:hypothetical protein Dip510_001658 [Elusimicrobium posterum]|uniref:hypothetical protein n=1 Tax=Elusimicrobium posterum TaxID=3116653 RepID=UPI003C760160